MTESTASPAPPTARPLDDVMIAMDVVDTLRHDKRIAERELNEDGRRAELIERLREIYKGQGIDVPDSILEEGVKALEEKRFVYTPPASSLQVRLARLYVTRARWGRRVAGTGVAAALVSGGWYVGVERPKAVERARIERELGQELPARVDSAMGQIEREAKRPAIVDEARQLAASARSAAAGGQREAARQAAQQLQAIVDTLRQEFEIRIVNRRGEVTGLWRVPKVNPDSRNYYLVVEAVDRQGTALAREILNEETGQRETVKKWALRVPKAVFDEIQADKQDDGIIQKSVLGAKARGETEPEWRLSVSGGALTRW